MVGQVVEEVVPGSSAGDEVSAEAARQEAARRAGVVGAPVVVEVPHGVVELVEPGATVTVTTDAAPTADSAAAPAEAAAPAPDGAPATGAAPDTGSTGP